MQTPGAKTTTATGGVSANKDSPYPPVSAFLGGHVLSNEQFDVEAVLRRTTFNTNVELEDEDEAGKEIKRTLTVRYHFDSVLEEQIEAGMPDEKALVGYEKRKAENKLEGDERPPANRNLTVNEQLALIVIGVKGVDKPIDAAYWRGVSNKHKNAIIKAINRDIYPS